MNDKNDISPNKQPQISSDGNRGTKSADPKQRVADALRENLRKRKEQMRDRQKKSD